MDVASGESGGRQIHDKVGDLVGLADAADGLTRDEGGAGLMRLT